MKEKLQAKLEQLQNSLDGLLRSEEQHRGAIMILNQLLAEMEGDENGPKPAN